LRRAFNVRTLSPGLPRSILILETGSLANAFGNGMVIAYLLIYLHNVRGLSLPLSGLALATMGIAALVAAPTVGALLDVLGGRTVLGAAMLVSAAGFGGFILVHRPWEAFASSLLAGAGNGAFWPANSQLLAELTDRNSRHTAFALQRVANNLGIGLGAVAGGLIATTSDPSSYTVLFLIDVATFLFYLVALAFVPASRNVGRTRRMSVGGYRTLLRDRRFLGFLVLDAFFVSAAFAWLQDLLPAFAKNHNGVSEHWIGLIFLANTLTIVVCQMPIARLLEGRRRMTAYATQGLLWTAAWLIVFVCGLHLDAAAAAVGFGVAASLFGVGECFQGTVRGALTTDLAPPALLGRYLAAASVSFQVGYSTGRAVGGYLLATTPLGLWLVGAGLCLTGGALSLWFERWIPAEIRLTPRRTFGPGSVPVSEAA
jgi:MFS family permease